jgi:regulator of protease activity HflC (stomatin/prohibitin superfamily)
VLITAIVLFLIAAGGVAVAAFSRDRIPGLGGAGLFGVLGLIALLIASVSTVPTRNVGIVTEFNKPTGRTTGAGLKWHAPWQSIDDWDASGQTYMALGDRCVWVTIAAQRRACIPVQIEWSSNANRAPENWAAYKEVDDLSRFQVFEARRVNPQINAAMTSVFASFDPLKAVNATTGDTPAPDLNATYKQPLIAALNTALGEDIDIRSVAFEAPRYDDPTTAAINAYGQKVLEARNLQIDKANAVTRAEITNTDAKVDQVARCLQIAEKLGKEPGLCMTPATITRPVS